LRLGAWPLCAVAAYLGMHGVGPARPRCAPTRSSRLQRAADARGAASRRAAHIRPDTRARARLRP
jgi:hypothetical protein